MEKKYISEYPNLIAEWDWSKNPYSPSNVSRGSPKICWWICSKCGHQWKTPAYSRTAGYGCPECAKKSRGAARMKTFAQRNNFAKLYPEIAKEWHPSKNGELSANDVSVSSNVRAWWLCSFCGHEWKTTVNHRTSENNGCPKCSRARGNLNRVKKVASKNNLVARFPFLMEEWHPSKNGELNPKDLPAGSGVKVWWLCSFCGHEWKTTVLHRTSGQGCPRCMRAQTSFAEQLIFYYVSQVFPDAINRYKDEFEFDIYIPKKKTAIEYDGTYYHSSAKSLTRDNLKDQYCRENGIRLIRFRSCELPKTEFATIISLMENQLTENLYQLFELLSITDVPDIDINRDSLKIHQQFKQKRIENSVAHNAPHLMKEWNYEKNGNLSPFSVAAYSNVKVWWICKACGYEWRSDPAHRSSGRNCPVCSGRVVEKGKNDLETLCPELVKQWDYEKNKEVLPSQFTINSNKKVWWRCQEYNHSWQATICERTRKGKATNCPYCGNKKVLEGFNDLATTHPNVARTWHGEKNQGITPKEVTYGSSKKVWWLCEKCGYEWEALIYSRTKGTGCPKCAKKV